MSDFNEPVEVDPNEPTPLADDLSAAPRKPYASDEDLVIPVDGDNPESIDEALRKHHETHGA
jgi:hypothetical protein